MVKSIIFLLVLLAISFADLPLPKRYDGYKKGSPSAPILFEMYGDYQCPSTRACWSTIKDVLDHYGNDKIYFIFHVYPIWSHRQAWDVSKGVAVMYSKNTRKDLDIWGISDYMFNHQNDFINPMFVNKTQTDLFKLLAGYAKDLIGLDEKTFMATFQSDDIYYFVDYGMHLGITKRVLGTPTFFINGFISTADSFTSYDDWIKIIDGLLK